MVSSDGASGSFVTWPAIVYFLNFMFMFVIFVTSTLDHALVLTYGNVMIYALKFRIKMNRNWSLIPTYTPLDKTVNLSCVNFMDTKICTLVVVDIIVSLHFYTSNNNIDGYQTKLNLCGL